MSLALLALTLATFLAGCTSEEEQPASRAEGLAGARTLAADGKLKEAQILLEKLAEAEKREARRAEVRAELAGVLCQRAGLEARAGRSRNAEVFYREAAARARQALEDGPGLARGHEELGIALLGLDRLEEAMVALQEAVAAEPALPRALKAMGLVEYRRGRFTEAIGRYRQAREELRREQLAAGGELQESPALVYHLAVALEARGRVEDLKEARDLFRLYAGRLGADGAEKEEAGKAVESITQRLEKEASSSP